MDRSMTSQVEHPGTTETGSLAPLVQLTNAGVKLEGRTIWHNANLSVYPGEFIAILGPNGAGKSTLIKAILGLVPVADGEITVFGAHPGRGHRELGYVPQRRSFGADVHVRGRDVVRLGLDGARWGVPLVGIRTLWGGGKQPRENRARVQAVIEMVGAAGYADRPIGEVSGGEQQRLLIAQALVTRPKLLLLDEPLDGLDLNRQQEIAAVIRRVSQERNTAVLLVAHDVNPLLPYVDRICYLAHGHMACGRPEEIITSETLSGLYGAPIDVLRARDGRLVVVGQPEGMPCTDFHTDGTG